ncbi:MAG: SBBP repeat-containing protein [candidate division WOR-3 bacterium]
MTIINFLKRKIFILFLFSPILISFLHSQSFWEARYNGTGNWADYPAAIQLFPCNYEALVYVTGKSYGDTSYYDFLTIKYNERGEVLWARRYNSEFNGYDAATDLRVDREGNAFVIGYSQGRSGYDFLILKYRADGELLWEKRLNGPGNSDDLPYCSEIDGEGNFYVAGISFFDVHRGYDALLVKYNGEGETLWTRIFNNDSNGDDIPRALTIDQEGNIILALYSWGGRNNFDYLVLKYDQNGNLVFQKRFNGPGNDDDYPAGIATDENRNIYIVGTSYGENADYWLLKLSPSGETLWTRRVDRGRDDHAWGIKWTGTWDFICVTGYSYSPISGYDILSICYDENGVERWRQIYDGGGDDFAFGLTFSSGYLLVTGTTQSNRGDYDYISLFYFDFTGRERFRHFYDGPAGRNDYGFAATGTDRASYPKYGVAGWSEGRGSYYDYYIACYWNFIALEERGLHFSQKQDGLTEWTIYDITGRKIKALRELSGKKLEEGKGESFRNLPSGIYILKSETGKRKKIIIPK